MPNFGFDVPKFMPNTGQPAPRDVGSDAKDSALSSGGGGASTGTAPAPEEIQRPAEPVANSGTARQVDDSTPADADMQQDARIRDAREARESRGQDDRQINFGRPGSKSADSTSVIRIPASLAAAAQKSLIEHGVSRSEAVAAYLCALLGDDAEAPDDIREIAKHVIVASGDNQELKQEIVRQRDEIHGLHKLLDELITNNHELMAGLVWLIGERLGSPGSQITDGAAGLHTDFSESELIRLRIKNQTKLRDEEVRTRRGREIEQAMFRKKEQGR